MLHVSTRGDAPAVGFTEALLAGLARDGGLYVPERWPRLDRAMIAGFAGQSYGAVAGAVVGALVDGEIAPDPLAAMIRDAYAGFRHPVVCPLVQIDDNLFVQELFHGPTLAFKDVAMQLLARLTDRASKERGQRLTIVGATSGDTGSAAIAAFADLPQVDLFILYPHGRISPVQRRQMTTAAAPNVHALAIEGTFDDCQAIVKGLFNHHSFRDAFALCGVNSINWARIVAQTVYYFTAAVALGAPHRQVSFAVPTGNFGDVFAGFAAKRMGLPIARLAIATNDNDILVRALAAGRYERRGVKATSSPSMDIEVSSNFERLLFEATGRAGAPVCAMMASLAQSGAFAIAEAPLAFMRREFAAHVAHEDEVTGEIRRAYARAGYVLDPHSAVGIVAARRELARHRAIPVVALATAHPAKFPDAVEGAIGIRPALPAHLADLLERRERFTVIANDQALVEACIRAAARGVEGAAA